MADQQLLKKLQPLMDQESLLPSYVRTVEQTIVPLARRQGNAPKRGESPDALRIMTDDHSLGLPRFRTA
ncbi:hypothetical protein ACJO5Y_13605 [Marinobacter sp. GN3S48]|uniref:hypothetical protein n=1 Tax=Marinobacter sp. GN3S48 TaxID=3382302 RepID=UPI00387B8337